MARRWTGAVLALGMGVLVAGCSVFGGKAADEPSHVVVRTEGEFEIRDYPALVVARVRQTGPRDAAVGDGFGRLFNYITGANTGARDIAMTAPVITNPATPNPVITENPAPGAEIAMTAPVLTTGDDAGGWETVFVLPADMTLATAPQPTDPLVTLGEIPARRVAVIRFSGRLGGERAEAPRARLAAWLAAQGLAHAGDWQIAGYNPPWTLPPLRRNEILVTLVP